MSLANDQITAQNFKDFYNGIRPYLNGQVPTFANAFNRSDLYSTDEKIVGCWVDGKPLYQRTFVSNEPFTISDNTDNYNRVIADATNIELVSSEGFMVHSSGLRETLPALYTSTDGLTYYSFIVKLSTIDGVPKICIRISIKASTSSKSFSGYFVTVRYTKTTDTAIKVGDGNDYSTDEQIIGTWIDGKPLYQKVVDCGKGPNATTKNVPHEVSNMDTCVKCTLLWNQGSGATSTGNKIGVEIAGAYAKLNDQNRPMVVGYIYQGNIIIVAENDQSSGDYVAILQYTKTTD